MPSIPPWTQTTTPAELESRFVHPNYRRLVRETVEAVGGKPDRPLSTSWAKLPRDVRELLVAVERGKSFPWAPSAAEVRTFVADVKRTAKAKAPPLCRGHKRHWYSVYGRPGVRADRCQRCGAPRPKAA